MNRGSFIRGREHNNSNRGFREVQSQDRDDYKTNSVFKIIKTLLTTSVEGQMKKENFNTYPIQNVSSQNVLSRTVCH